MPPKMKGRQKPMTEPREDGGPAFPGHATGSAYDHGMTLRDWFAGQAIEGLVGRYGGMMVERMTDLAYQIADEAIKRRKETPEETCASSKLLRPRNQGLTLRLNSGPKTAKLRRYAQRCCLPRLTWRPCHSGDVSAPRRPGGGERRFAAASDGAEERAPTPTARRHGTGFLGCSSRFVARVGEPLPWCITLDNSKGISRLRFWAKNRRVNGINDLPVFMHQGTHGAHSAGCRGFCSLEPRGGAGRKLGFRLGWISAWRVHERLRRLPPDRVLIHPRHDWPK